MIRIVRTATLAALRAENETMTEEANRWHGQYEAATQAEADAAIREGDVRTELEKVRAELEAARVDLARARGELDTLRSLSLLDTEDRAVLRAMLKTARKQTRLDRVYVLFRRGRLHSVHATLEAAEAAAEAEGASRDGWTSLAPGAALQPASEVAWRVQPLPLGGV